MTPSVTVTLVGAPDLGPALGKKGTQSDLTLYNHVRDGHAATVVIPTQYPEKFPPLLQAVAMADRAVFVVPALDRTFAEAAATLDLFDLPVELRRGETVGEAELRRALRSSRLETLPIASIDPPRLREEIEHWTAPARTGSLVVSIDHAFPVRGVGAVALGVVRRGTLETHAKLTLYPDLRAVEVRSIQVHDEDVDSASVGDRVGVALRGVEAEELSRGQALAPEGSLVTGPRVELGALKRCRYYRGTVSPGSSFQLQIGLQVVPAKVESASAESLVVVADRPLAWSPGDLAHLADLSIPSGPRIVLGGTL
ncbi:MAG TPA: EF-Tu/IF-2/RF-3 family GTPase [Thermoplasmata archaeon]|nr:EF-Tu/IF-2/RF-3 family GTPase [Thermoplasmata archaeon]